MGFANNASTMKELHEDIMDDIANVVRHFILREDEPHQIALIRSGPV